MKDSITNTLEEEFLAEFKTLLEKYDVCISYYEDSTCFSAIYEEFGMRVTIGTEGKVVIDCEGQSSISSGDLTPQKDA
jgi:hypothetical protein